jgi:predicted ATPase/DNA-binding SARP family transcriptional activator
VGSGSYALDVLQISLLGPLEVRRDGLLVSVSGGKASELLVRLALEAGVQVRADRLVDDLWTGVVGIRRNTLQAKVALLRRALGDPPVIVSGDGGYALAVDPSAVDALAALAHAVTAARLLDAGDDRGAADLCASTLTLYRGDVLPAAGDGDWVTPHRARFEETRMRLLEIRFAARSRLGDVGDVIGELEEAVATYPFQEGLWELLITALYRAGRQADALTAYQRVRNRLSDELGLEPGPPLQQLEQRILTHDPIVDDPHRRSDSSAHDARGGNLPSMSVELIGRQGEINAVSDLLGSSRLVEIVGPGGIGKTALAIATGRGLVSTGAGSGGVWLARLETASTPNDVIDTVIAALTIPGGEEALFERLKGTAAVVILDNCEHVLDAAAALAVRLLDAAPGLRILCTSQVQLGVDGEAVFELEPLALSDAAELFTRRATAQRLTRTTSEGDDGVLGLCRALDGLPLAIELAAARTRTLSIEEITRRLDDRFSVLSDPTSRRPERRRSLRSTIRWSYDLLFPDDQRGLWALATFAGGAPLPAVEFVLKALDVPAAAAIDVVGRLASRSLLIVDDPPAALPMTSGPESPPVHPVRYRLLDSIRAFALEALADARLTARAFAAYAAWFAKAASSSTQGVRSGRQAEYLAFARVERANIDAALTWSAAHDPLLALGIANGFGWAWVVLGDSRGAERILVALAAAGDAGQVRDRAGALLLAAWIEASTGDLDLARDHITVATELADTINDVDLQARCSYYLAYVLSHHGEFSHALELTDRSNALYDGLDRPWDQAANWLFAARAAISAGDQERSVEAVDLVRHWLRTVDDPWLHVRGDAIIGELARLQHRFDDAVLHLGRAAETSRRLGFQQTEAYQLSSLGRAQCQAGDYQTGSATLELAVEKAEATGDVRLAALARVHLGRVLRALGDVARSRTAIEAATAWHRAAGGGEQAALGECLLAAMDAEDRVPAAGKRLVAVLDDARHRGDAPVEVFALDALARFATESGDIDTARDLFGSADRRMAAASHFITDFDRSDARLVRQLP